MRQVVPPFVGVLVAVVIGLLLAEAVPTFMLPSDLGMLPVLAIQFQSAVQWFLAVFAGALVARGRFMKPALALTVIGWGAVVYIAYDIVRVAPVPELPRFAVLNLAGLLLYIVAAASAGILAKRFYRSKLGNLHTTA